MAPPPPRRAALLMLLSLLAFSVVIAHAAREAPAAASSRSHPELQQGQDKEVDSKDEATSFTAAEDDGSCGGAGDGEGGEGEEECLMRRTLVAHTDYIYTQGGGHN